MDAVCIDQPNRMFYNNLRRIRPMESHSLISATVSRTLLCARQSCNQKAMSRHNDVIFSVAYLGFQKGGPNFRWPLVLTQRGGKPSFPIFLVCQQKNFLAKGGPWHNGLPLNKYATEFFTFKTFVIRQIYPVLIIIFHWLPLSETNLPMGL